MTYCPACGLRRVESRLNSGGEMIESDEMLKTTIA
jgi:hypothetical protein